ncbi:MAG: outer membrane beta-barrel protein, partial [Chitinophagaceae bacterium]
MPLSPSSDFTFEPGMLLASKGNKFDRFYDSSSASRTDTLFFRQEKKIGYIEFPLNIAYTYRFAKSSQLRFSAGPYISFFRKGKRATEFRSYQTKRYLKD